jgi:hypothetical protein
MSYLKLPKLESDSLNISKEQNSKLSLNQEGYNYILASI